MELVLQAGHRLQYFRVTELRFLSTFSSETQLFPSLNAPATALSLPIASFSHPIPKELAERRSKAEKRIKRRVPGHMHWIVCCPPAFNEANSGVNAAEHWKSYQSNWMEIVLSSQIPCWAQVLKQGWQDWIEAVEFLSQFTVPARALWFTGKKMQPVSIQSPMQKPHKTLWSDLPWFCFVSLKKISPCLSLYYDCNKKYFTPEQFIGPGACVSLFLRYFEHFTSLQRAVFSLRWSHLLHVLEYFISSVFSPENLFLEMKHRPGSIPFSLLQGSIISERCFYNCYEDTGVVSLMQGKCVVKSSDDMSWAWAFFTCGKMSIFLKHLTVSTFRGQVICKIASPL